MKIGGLCRVVLDTRVLNMANRIKLGDQIRNYAKQNKQDIEVIATVVMFEISKSIALADVRDTGRFTANWFATNSKPSSQTTKSTTRDSMGNVAEKIKGVMKKYGTYYFTNNLEYARLIEYGLYPKSVKRGTRNKKTGIYEIRTKNGFSKQAPKGVVRISIIRMNRDFLKITKSDKIVTTKSGTRDWSKRK